MTKRLLVILLTLSMVISCTAPALAATSAAVSELQPIQGLPSAFGNGVMTVEPGTMFNPDGVLFDGTYGFPSRLGYRTLTEYYAEMNYLAKEYPHLVKKHVIGQGKYGEGGTGTWDGNPLFALEISNAPGSNDGRPSALHMGVNHGGELPAAELAMNLGWYLITQYDKNDEVTNLLNTTTIWLLPVTNPDGLHYSQQYNDHRKNRNPNNGATGSSIGVDFNRNWPYGWGSTNGSSSAMNSSTYRGIAPASEPEVQAITKVYETNQVVTSISGHTSGQLIIYAWGHQHNSEGQPLLAGLAREMSEYNLHADHFSEALYPASGDLCDYTWGLARALHFTVEYGRSRAPAYMGFDMYKAIPSYNDKYGKQRSIPVSYATNANVAKAGAPAQDVVGDVVYIADDPNLFRTGYGGPETVATVAMVNALGDLTGKILLTPRGTDTNTTRDIILAAQAKGAVGVLLCVAGEGLYNVNGAHYTPSFGTSGTSLDINIPVMGTSKPYSRECYEQLKAGASPKMTITSYMENAESLYYQWERNIGAYMKNMSFATEYASHIKGNITDGNGNPLPEATLNLSMMADGLVKHLGNYSNYVGSGDDPFPVGTYEVEHTSKYNVKGGTFDWSVVPSQQPDPQLPEEKSYIRDADGNLTGDRYLQIPDRGYNITASANGRYSDTKNVKVADYQLIIDNVNFDLPLAVDTEFKFDPHQDIREDIVVPFAFYDTDGSPYSGKVIANLNGQELKVDSLAAPSGEAPMFSVRFNLEAMGIASIDDAVLVITNEDQSASLVISTGVKSVNSDALTLTSDKGAVKSGDEFTITAAFENEVETNTAILTFNYDPGAFEFKGATAASGVEILTYPDSENEGQLKFAIMARNYDVTDILDLHFAAREDKEFNGALKTFSVFARYAVNTVPKSEAASTAVATVKTLSDEIGPFNLINLSDVIEWFGYDSTRSDWFLKYYDWDFDNSGSIGIYDVAYVAMRVVLD